MVDIRLRMMMTRYWRRYLTRVTRTTLLLIRTNTRPAMRSNAQKSQGVAQKPTRRQLFLIRTVAFSYASPFPSQARKQGNQPDIRTQLTLNRKDLPPYPLLYFQTVSLKLILGERTRTNLSQASTASTNTKPDQNPPLTSVANPAMNQTHWPMPGQGDRTPSVPLLSRTGRLVGSLHLDTRDAQPGTEVECLVVARALALTFGSALREEDVGFRMLLWVLHVVPSTREGIVERRGVGQIMVQALEEAAGAGPEVKTVLLG